MYQNQKMFGSAMINLDEFQTIGNLQKLIRKNIFYNMDLESETLEFVLDSSGFNIEGEGTLGGIDVFLKGRKNYKNHEEFISRYNIKTIINEKKIENFFNFKIEEFVSGPIGLDATYFIFKNNKKTIKTKNNLKIKVSNLILIENFFQEKIFLIQILYNENQINC